MIDIKIYEGLLNTWADTKKQISITDVRDEFSCSDDAAYRCILRLYRMGRARSIGTNSAWYEILPRGEQPAERPNVNTNFIDDPTDEETPIFNLLYCAKTINEQFSTNWDAFGCWNVHIKRGEREVGNGKREADIGFVLANTVVGLAFVDKSESLAFFRKNNSLSSKQEQQFLNKLFQHYGTEDLNGHCAKVVTARGEEPWHNLQDFYDCLVTLRNAHLFVGDK